MANCSNCQWGTFKGKTPTYHDYWCQCWSLYMPSWESCDKWESKKEKSKKGTLMGTCRKCKFFIWKSHEEEQEGICSLQPKHLAKTGLNHYCSRFEQKGASMGICKECKWWRQFDEHSGAGECRCLNVGTKEPYLGIISTYEFEGKDYMSPKVPSSFGCVHFEQKSKGPFEIRHSGDYIKLVFQSEEEGYQFYPLGSHEEAKKFSRLACWLNEHWRK